MRLYTAGPMTGKEFHNFPAFYAAAETLEQMGHQVENPADNDGGSTWEEAYANAQAHPKSWEYYLRRDLGRLLSCDGVVALPGWRESRGASLEIGVARKLKMPVYRIHEYWQAPPPPINRAMFKRVALEPLYTIIGLSGYAQSGKDTAAQFLIEEAGFERIAFADVLREALYRLNPITTFNLKPGESFRVQHLVDEKGWDRAKTEHSEIRALLQVLGTEVGRELIYEDVWVDAALKKMEDGGKYVITDVRFPNEAAAIKAWGGEIWRVARPNVGPVNNHLSETSLDFYDFDAMFRNDGSLDKFRADVLALYRARIKQAA